MTKTRLALLVLFGLVVPVSAADVSGNWKLNIKLNGVPELVCGLTQKDQRLEGTCKSAEWRADQGVDLSDGKIDGDQVSWSWKVPTPDGNTWTCAFNRRVTSVTKQSQ